MPMIEIEVNQNGRATSEASVRGHRVVVDRPTAKGGDDNGPMGGEFSWRYYETARIHSTA